MFTILLGKRNRLFHQNRSQDSTLISVLLNAVLTVSHWYIFFIFRVTTTNISPDDLSTTRVLLILYLKNAGKIVEHILIHCWTESFPISKQRKLKVFSSINNVRHFVYTLMRSAQSYKHYTARCCPGQVGRWNLIVARGMLKPVYFAVAETMLEFFLFCKLHILHPGSNGPSSKCSFSSALRSSLTRLRREPSVSIYKKKMSSGTQGTHFVKSRAHLPKPTSNLDDTALRSAILMKADPVASLHANRLFSGRACSCKKDPSCF